MSSEKGDSTGIFYKVMRFTFHVLRIIKAQPPASPCFPLFLLLTARIGHTMQNAHARVFIDSLYYLCPPDSGNCDCCSPQRRIHAKMHNPEGDTLLPSSAVIPRSVPFPEANRDHVFKGSNVLYSPRAQILKMPVFSVFLFFSHLSRCA